MSIWTPSGEHEVSEGKLPEEMTAEGKLPEEMTAEEQETLAEDFEETRKRIAQTPVEQIITTHIIGLYELAVIHLKNEPPNLDQAKLAIDALAAIVQSVGDDMGEYESAMRSALTEIQLAYVNVSSPDVDASEPSP